jgi:hypothetical protein
LFCVTCSVANIRLHGNLSNNLRKEAAHSLRKAVSHTSTPVNAAKGSTASHLVEFSLEVCTTVKDEVTFVLCALCFVLRALTFEFIVGRKNVKLKEQSTKHKVQSTKYEAQSTKHLLFPSSSALLPPYLPLRVTKHRNRIRAKQSECSGK